MYIFKPPPPVGAGGGYMFLGRPSVRASVRDSRGSFMFPRYLQYLLTDFRQTFVTGASWDTDDLITFLGEKVKVQGHTIAAEAHSTRRYRRVKLFLVTSIMCVARNDIGFGIAAPGLGIGVQGFGFDLELEN